MSIITGYSYQPSYDDWIAYLPPSTTQWNNAAVPVGDPTWVYDYIGGIVRTNDGWLVAGSLSGYIARTQAYPPESAGDWTEVFDGSTVGYPLFESNGLATDGVKIRALQLGTTGGFQRIFGSDDQGATWNITSSFPNDPYSSFSERYNTITYNGNGVWALLGSEIYSSGRTSFTYIAISTDGDNWTNITPPDIADFKNAIAVGYDPDVIAIAKSQSGNDASVLEIVDAEGYLSLDGGQTWAELDFGIGADVGIRRGTLSAFTNPLGQVCLVGYDGIDNSNAAANKVYIHVGNNTWESYSLPLPSALFGEEFLANEFNDVSRRLTSVDHANGITMIANSQDFVNVSYDNGHTWDVTLTLDESVGFWGQTFPAALWAGLGESDIPPLRIKQHDIKIPRLGQTQFSQARSQQANPSRIAGRGKNTHY